MTLQDPTTSTTSTAPATGPGNRLLANVLAQYGSAVLAHMNAIKKTLFAQKFADNLLLDPTTRDELTLEELAVLLADPTYGPELRKIRFFDLVLAVIDQNSANAEKIAPAAEQTEVAPTKVKAKPGPKPKQEKAAAEKPAKAPKKEKAPKQEKASKQAKAAASSTTTRREPVEVQEVFVAKILAAVEKAGASGLKIAPITAASGLTGEEGKIAASKLVKRMVEKGELVKMGQAQGTTYHMPSSAA